MAFLLEGFKSQEIRESLLKEFQKSGYSCYEDTKYYFRVIGLNCSYITLQHIRTQIHSVCLDIVVKEKYGEDTIKVKSIKLNRDTFEEEFQSKIINTLISWGVLNKMIKPICTEYSEEEIKKNFDKALKTALRKEKISVFPQTIKSKYATYRVNIWLEKIDNNAIRPTVEYKAEVVQKTSHQTETKQTMRREYCEDLEDSIRDLIKGLKSCGCIEETPYAVVFQEFQNILSGSLTDKDIKKAFSLAYSKGGKDKENEILCEFQKLDWPPLYFHSI